MVSPARALVFVVRKLPESGKGALLCVSRALRVVEDVEQEARLLCERQIRFPLLERCCFEVDQLHLCLLWRNAYANGFEEDALPYASGDFRHLINASVVVCFLPLANPAVRVDAAVASSLEHLVVVPTDLVFDARVSRGKHVLERQNLRPDSGRLARARVDQRSDEQPLVNGLLYPRT